MPVTIQLAGMKYKNDDGEFQSADALKGDVGLTPDFSIGTVTTLQPNQDATVTITGTDEEPVLNFGIPKGDKGDPGEVNIDDTAGIGDTNVTYSADKLATDHSSLLNAITECENAIEELDAGSLSAFGASNGQVPVAQGDGTWEWQDQSGGGGTSDYADLENKPQINGVMLAGNKSASDLGLLSGQGVAEAVDSWLDENITNPDSPPLDRSLTSDSAAAPADMVGYDEEQIAMLVNKQLKPQPIPTETVQCVDLTEQGVTHVEATSEWRYRFIKVKIPYDGEYCPNPYGKTYVYNLKAYDSDGNVVTKKDGTSISFTYNGRLVFSNDRNHAEAYLPEPDGRKTIDTDLSGQVVYLANDGGYICGNKSDIGENDKLGVTYGTPSTTYIEYDESKFPVRPSGYDYEYKPEMMEAVAEYIEENYTNTLAVDNATAESVGKSLLAKTVSGGKIIDWDIEAVAKAEDVPYRSKLVYSGNQNGASTNTQTKMNIVCTVPSGKHLTRIGVMGNANANGEVPTLNILVPDSVTSGKYTVAYSKTLTALAAGVYSYTDIDFTTSVESYIAVGETGNIVHDSNGNLGYAWTYYNVSDIQNGSVIPTVNVHADYYWGVMIWEEGESKLYESVEITDEEKTVEQAIEILPDESWYQSGSSYDSSTSWYISPRIIKAGNVVSKIRFKANASSTAKFAFFRFDLHSTINRMLTVDVVDNITVSSGWNEVVLNKHFNTDVLLGYTNISMPYIDYVKCGLALFNKNTMFGSADDVYNDASYFKPAQTVEKGEYTSLYNIVAASWVSFPFTWYEISGVQTTLLQNNGILMGEYEKQKSLREVPVLPKYKVIDGSLGFVGKWYETQVDGQDAHVCNAFGGEIYFRVKGTTSVTIEWGMDDNDDHSYYAYNIDGGTFTRVAISSPTITLPDTNSHIVRIVCDSLGEGGTQWAVGGGFVVLGVDAGNGTAVGLLPERTSRIVHLGDSITVGCRALGVETGSESQADYNSVINSYSWHCSQALNAISYMNGYGGTGLTNSGSTANCSTMIDYAAPGVEATPIVADLVVLEHGHNDSTATDANFKTAYQAILDQIRVMYPGAPIVCVIPFNQQKASVIKEVVPDEEDCYLVDCNERYPNRFYVDGPGHLSAAGGVDIGNFIAKKIKDYGLL